MWHELLERFEPQNRAEAEAKSRLLHFLALTAEGEAGGREVVGNGEARGHITVAGWVLNADHSRVLLVSDPKRRAVALPSGHLEGTEPLAVQALCWVRELTGLEAQLLQTQPFSLGALWVPEYWNTPAHWHYEIRFLMVAAEGRALPASARWLSLAAAAEYEAMVELVEKTVNCEL